MNERIEHLAEGVSLYLGDCREILPTLKNAMRSAGAPHSPEPAVAAGQRDGGGGFDAIIVDPPYGETSLGWDKRVVGWPAMMLPVMKPGGSMWVFGSQRMFLECAPEFVGWRFSHDVVWEKHNGTGLFNDRFRRVHENALHWYKADSTWDSVFKAPQFTNDATAKTVQRKGRPAQWIGATGETIYLSEDGGPRLMRSVIYVRSEHGRGHYGCGFVGIEARPELFRLGLQARRRGSETARSFHRASGAREAARA